MKKFFIVLFVIIGSTATVDAQQTAELQNQQNQQTSTAQTAQTADQKIFYINGIPSTQDIGGVTALYKIKGRKHWLFIKNHNSSTVTVLFEYVNRARICNGSIVLKPGESDMILSGDNRIGAISHIATITRKL